MDLPIRTDVESFVIVGVDTHADAHVAVALDGLGRRLGHKTVPSTGAGYAVLLAWLQEFGTLDRAGIEGSGSFGVGLNRFLRERGVEVFEVNRPNRQHRRRFGRHDTADAEAAARAVQANSATGEPKAADGTAEMVRALRVVRRSAVKARTQAVNQLRALLVTAPERLRAELRGLSTARLIATAARFRTGTSADGLRAATKLAMRALARRHLMLSEEIAELDAQLARLVAEAAPALASMRGVGTDTAAALLVAVGDNPERPRVRPLSPACAE
jgi:hypothetical protein